MAKKRPNRQKPDPTKKRPPRWVRATARLRYMVEQGLTQIYNTAFGE